MSRNAAQTEGAKIDCEVAENAHDPRATRLLEELGTEPKVIFLKEKSG